MRLMPERAGNRLQSWIFHDPSSSEERVGRWRCDDDDENEDEDEDILKL